MTDWPILRAMEHGNPYPTFEGNRNWEGMAVVVDDNDQPVAACAAERIVQLYLWMGEMHPAAKMHALRMLHEAMAEQLKAKGYDGAEAFLPPAIAVRFGRRLERSLGWVRNWPSWCRRL